LGSAVMKDDECAVRGELEKDREQLKRPCSEHMLPLRLAINNQRYKALKELLDKSDTRITDLKCRGNTVLQLACVSRDTETLNYILEYSDKFNFPPEVYNENLKI
jgi:ankyrin repeat protein